MVQFLLKLLLKQISCCAPRIPFISTAKFHSLHVKEPEILESRSHKFWKGRSRKSDILPSLPTQPWSHKQKEKQSDFSNFI